MGRTYRDGNRLTKMTGASHKAGVLSPRLAEVSNIHRGRATYNSGVHQKVSIPWVDLTARFIHRGCPEVLKLSFKFFERLHARQAFVFVGSGHIKKHRVHAKPGGP